MTLDLLIRGGLVVDGSGRPGFVADVALAGGRVREVGHLPGATAARLLDVQGLAVAPGFIDIHSHSDCTLLVDPRAQSQLFQGVTTELIGNCGHGCAPVSDPELVKANVYGYQPGFELGSGGLGAYLDRLERANPALNVATLVPNGNLRLATVGLEPRAAEATEVAAMSRLLEEGLEAGAFGLSTGLEYPAERACSEAELVALCKVVARSGGIYATHTRNREVEALEAIEEQVRVAEASGVPLQVSHIIPRRGGPEGAWQSALELIDRARARGLDVTFDSHTRLFGITNLSNALPPAEFAASPDLLAARLRDPAVRARLKSHQSIVSSFGLGGWDRVSLYTSSVRPDLVGGSFAELAPPGGDALDAVYDLLGAEAEDVHGPLCVCHSYEEEWLRATFQHPLCMPGSDAVALCTEGPLAGSSFPGAYTWAAWFLRRLVRETGDLSLEEGVRKLTALPAARLGLADRGRLEPGCWADVAVFDPSRVAERGTLDQPNRLAEGITHVCVNGVLAIEDGKTTGVRSGRVLRRR